MLARGTGEYLERRGIPAEKLAYVPNGVDLNAFGGGGERPAREGLTLVYAGAHGPFNGLDAVLGAAELLRDRAVRFLLVGDGPSKAELVASAQARGLRNVEFRDPVAKVRMPALLAEADAGLMVLREADRFSFGVSPNKLFDYLGAALPVVCNVPGEVAGMLAASGAGVQASDASAAALAAAIARMESAGHDARRRMGARGREWVGAEHGRDVLGSNLDELLRREIGR